MNLQRQQKQLDQQQALLEKQLLAQVFDYQILHLAHASSIIGYYRQTFQHLGTWTQRLP